jgi:hypothetical protein
LFDSISQLVGRFFVSHSSTEKGKRRGPSATEMIVKGGFLNFNRAVRFAARYGAECRKAGDVLTITEYAKAVGMTRAHCYREQQAWRKCVGNFTVQEILSEEALAGKGLTEDQREAAIARELLQGRP